MDLRKLSMQELLRLCLESNDQAAWREFVRRIQPLIARVVMKTLRQTRPWKVPSPQEIDDLVQETFLKLFANDFRALRQFDCRHENAIYGWIKVVTSNLVQDYIRNSMNQKNWLGRELEELEEARAVPVSGASVSETAERNILFEKICRCLERLRGEPNFKRDSTIFWLYFRDGFTAKAIAELLGVGLTVKGVESVLLRLIRFLRDCFGDEAGAGAGR